MKVGDKTMSESKKRKSFNELRLDALTHSRARALLESLGRPELTMDVSKPWQIGRGVGVGDKVRRGTPVAIATLIKKAKRPLFVLGPLCLEVNFDGKPAIDYAVEIAKVTNMPVVATGHVMKGLIERGLKPDVYMPLVNIVDRLRDPEWRGVRGEGQHDLVVFLGISSTIAEQGLSTLKHFAPHLKTVTLCPIYYPSADMPLIAPPFVPHSERLARLIEALKE